MSEGSGPEGYDGVADAFARLSRRFTAALADALVARAHPRPGERVLDVGTGTGVLARAAAARVGPAGEVVGIDVSEALLERARAEPPSTGFAPLTYERREAERLGLDGASFDIVCSLFALAHVRDAAAALREMHRVLRPGGRLAVGVGAGAPPLHAARVRRLALRIQAWRGQALLAPGLLARGLARDGASLEKAPHLSPERLQTLLRRAGFHEVRRSWIGGEAEIGDTSDLWELETTFSTPGRRWRATASPEDVERRRLCLLDEAEGVLARGGRILYLSGAAVLEGRRAAA